MLTSAAALPQRNPELSIQGVPCPLCIFPLPLSLQLDSSLEPALLLRYRGREVPAESNLSLLFRHLT